jgi:pre-mRNA-splicing factor 18
LDKDRRLRLRALELIEEKGTDRQGGQNDFRKALEDVESVEREMKNKSNKGKKKEESGEFPNSGALDLGLVKSDPDKLYPIIYYALKRTLKEWEEAMDERPGAFQSCGLQSRRSSLHPQNTSNALPRESSQLPRRFNLPNT